jgi:hypothetical protein
MKRKKSKPDERGQAAKLLRIAQKAPPPQRSKLTPFIGVVMELRSKGYSYEKIADFLNEHTGREFTRSQVFAFVKRNSAVLGTFDQEQEGLDSEPLPNQLVFEHSRALLDVLPKGVNGEARILSAREVSEIGEKPEKDGVIGNEFFTTYRLRKTPEGIVPEWWNGAMWTLLTAASLRRIHEEAVVQQFLKEGSRASPRQRQDNGFPSEP